MNDNKHENEFEQDARENTEELSAMKEAPSADEPAECTPDHSCEAEAPIISDAEKPDQSEAPAATSFVSQTVPPFTQPVTEAQAPPLNPQSFAPQPSTAYRWTYADQRAYRTQKGDKQRSRGLWLYALIMTGVFALSFGLLLGFLLINGREFPTVQFGESMTDANGQIIQTNDYADSVAIERTKKTVVLIEASSESSAGYGTGIILSHDGYIATNHHVIEGASTIRVRFYDGTYANATLRGSSEVDDLAVIKVDRTGLPMATFASSSECFVGQTVYAIGNPSGPEMAWTTTKGCISYVDREVKIYKEDGTLEKKLKMIQTDAMVNPGNSGGPLVNARGEVVGIVSMKLADGYEGIGFAIPSDGAAEILNAIIRDGNADSVNSNISYDRPVIGITGVYMEGGIHYVFEEDRIVQVSDSYAEENPDEVITPAVSGIYVSAVTEGMDAATKLKVGDIITAVNQVEATNMNVLMNEINEHYAGDQVTVTYYRNGLYSDVTITLGAARG